MGKSVRTSDFNITKNRKVSENALFVVAQKESNSIHPSYLEAMVTYMLGNLNVKRIFKLYDHCPAIACENYLKGTIDNFQSDKNVNVADLKNIEFAEDMNYSQSSAVLDQIKP